MDRPSPSTDEDLVRAAGHRVKYHPRGASAKLFSMRDDEILVAGPAGTGKSLGILHKFHLALSKYPGARGFMARETRSSMTNSCMKTFENHVLHPIDKVHLLKNEQVYKYPNGSEFAVVGLDDTEKIKSTDWDFGYIQEATETREDKWEVCTTRLRNWKMPYQQLVGDCNPDKPTHWLKKRCDKGQTKMIISHHEDNPRLWDEHNQQWTREGIQYLAKLQRLTGVRRARLYSGQWVASEGIIYEKWDAQAHIITIADLDNWYGSNAWTEFAHYWAIDFGHTHPFVWQLWIEAPDGRLFLIRQIYHTKTLVEDVAEYIMTLTEGLPIPRAIICDHDAEGRATFERHTGLLTLPAYKPIQEGIQAVNKRLEPNWDGKPGLFIVRDSLVSVDPELEEKGFPTCTEAEFDGYIWDQNLNRVVNSKKDELPVDKDNHGMDAMRYMVAFIDSLADDPEDIEGVLLYDDEIIISPY